MIKTTLRRLRAVAAALVIVALPVAGLTTTPAMAQDPMAGMGMGEAYPLTSDLVVAWVESYPEVLALTESMEDEFDFPEGEDPMAALAGIGMANAALDRLNGAVTPYGFEDWGQWTQVMFSVLFSYAILDAPAEQQAMMAQMFGQPQGNLDAVSANLALVAELVDSL